MHEDTWQCTHPDCPEGGVVLEILEPLPKGDAQ